MGIKHLVIVLLAVCNLSLATESWTAKNGNYSDFIFELSQKEGINQLFNCDLLVEKVIFDKQEKYWLTIFDDFSGHDSVLSLAIPNGYINQSKSKGFQFERNTGFDGIEKHISLIVKKDFNGEWAEIHYREFLTKPFKLTKNIKCSAER